jgi:hypothetical protein
VEQVYYVYKIVNQINQPSPKIRITNTTFPLILFHSLCLQLTIFRPGLSCEALDGQVQLGYGRPLLGHPALKPCGNPAIFGQPLAVGHLKLGLGPGPVSDTALKCDIYMYQLFEIILDCKELSQDCSFFFKNFPVVQRDGEHK